MLINLLDIPEEGKAYICNQNTGELNEAFRDLIGNTPYSTEFFIRPLAAGAYELSGKIKTEMPEECSRCGLDFKFNVDERFKELLIPEQSTPRTGKYAKANHLSDMSTEDLTVAEYQGHHFNAGDYLHELVAITEPVNPAPEEDEKGDCRVCKLKVRGKSFGYEDKAPEIDQPESPFSVLKNLKLN